MSDVEEAITRAHHDEWARVVAAPDQAFRHPKGLVSETVGGKHVRDIHQQSLEGSRVADVAEVEDLHPAALEPVPDNVVQVALQIKSRP